MTLILKNIAKLIQPNYIDLDAKLWVQKVILKKYLKKINNWAKVFKKDTLNNTYTLIVKQWAPVAQLDRALGYGPGGSGFKS